MKQRYEMKEVVRKEIFHSWLQSYQGILYKIIRAYSSSPMDQDDLFQEIALQLWRSIPSFRSEAKASTWIYRVALNTAIAWQGKEKKHGKQESIDKVEHRIYYAASENTDERLEWLYQEIAMLNKVDRSIALLLLDGFSYQEMSELIGITENNLAVKIHRIKKHLILKSEKYERHGV